MVKRVLIVGSNPSNSSPDESPFHEGTKSRKTIEAWIQGLDIEVHYINVVNSKLDKPPTQEMILSELPSLNKRIELINPDKVVAVGKVATQALTLLRCDFLEMPHPSGRNRKWNDKVFKEEKIKTLRTFILSV
jgi:uracil-DNA glycosylase